MATLYISEGSPLSGWYRPPKGTHGPGSQWGGPGGRKRAKADGGLGRGTAPTSAGSGNTMKVDDLLTDWTSYIADEPLDWLDADEETRSGVKAMIVGSLSDQTGVDPSDVNQTLGAWAVSSNNANMNSLSIQQDVSEEFGVPLSKFTQDRIAATKAAGGSSAERTVSADDQRKVLRAMYDETQASLGAAGVKGTDTITLYRGVITPTEKVAGYNVGDVMPVEGNAVSSWSTSEDVSSWFAMPEEEGVSGLIMSMDVPVKSVLSTAATGLGCLTEGEVTVLSASGAAKITHREDAGWATPPGE